MATTLDKSRFGLKRFVKVLSLLPVLVVFADEGTVPQKTTNDLYLDPCKEVRLWGAMSDDEFRAIGKVLLEQMKKVKIRTSLPELQQDDWGPQKEEYKQLQKEIKYTYLLKILRENVTALISPCQEQQYKKPCGLEKTELRNRAKIICTKWRRLKMQIRRLKEKNLENRNAMLKFLLAEKHSSESNTIKQSVLLKQKRLLSKFNWAHKRKKGTNKLAYRLRRAATANKSLLWEHGVIPYRIHRIFSASDRALFKRAMRHWENYTCITFKEKEPADQSSILFTVLLCGCCARIGNQGSTRQAVSIGESCKGFGTVVHELGHVVGFGHEHNRPDRDNHVHINTYNIRPGNENNFNNTRWEVDSLGEPYDFDSIMHYSLDAYALNKSMDTIVPLGLVVTNISSEIGQRRRLSPGDIRQTNKLYNCSRCGRTFQKSRDRIHHTSTPGEPDSCQWRISAIQGEKIVLNITYLKLSMPPNCSKAYLEVRNGYYFKSQLLGRYCGDQIPPTLKSTGNWLWIHYMTNNGTHGGFAASYKAICGDEFMEDNGTFTSPNYPATYPPKKRCIWRITVTAGFSVALKFSFFQLEDFRRCKNEYVAVYDGPTETSPLLGKYCGNRSLDVIKTSGHQMYVKFVSDETVQEPGFSANFFKAPYRGEFMEDNGTFTSLNYPDFYPNLANFTWSITVTEGFFIALNFTDLQVEYAVDCASDYVAVYDGPTEASPLLGKYCGYERPDIIRTRGNQMYVTFVSDKSVKKHGFSASFIKSNISKCGGVFMEDNGTFTSPDYPDYYPNGADCTWSITVTEGFIVALNFTSFRIELGVNCEFDYVAVYDGPSEASPVFRKSCGYERPDIFTTRGNQMYVKFVTDKTVKKHGFSASFIKNSP